MCGKRVLSRSYVPSLVAMVVMALLSPLTWVNIGQGAAPEIQAFEIRGTVAPPPVSQGEDDDQMERPNHPPISLIRPMPMPRPEESGPSGGDQTVYVHNSETNETIELPMAEPGENMLFMKTGYKGADGGLGQEYMPEAFGDMTIISNPGDSPWRMNCKVVMRFVSTSGTSYYFCGSGAMIDAETVLTAGHCVYSRTPDGIEINDYAAEVWVYPGWDGVGGQFNPPPSTVNHYGYGRGTTFIAGADWINNGSFDQDIGVIRLTRAVGMLTGWFAIHSNDIESCDTIKARTYYNESFPAEPCGQPGIHNGADMYRWSGHFDSCPGNQLRIDTTGGCYNAGWGGMSGSGAYYMVATTRYVHAVSSNSNRSTIANYCKMWDAFATSTSTFITNSRGSVFDLQALDMNVEPATIAAGEQTTLLNHLGTNPTNNDPADVQYTYRVYLSTDDAITSGDTYLSTQVYTHDYSAMSNVRINMVMVTIPANTAPGTYWLGVIYDSATDGDNSNNDTSGWDAVKITVTCPVPPPPSNVDASDGDYTDRIWLFWPAVSGADYYEVWRATVNDSGSATRIASSVVPTSYNDTTATVGTLYYYWLKTVSDCNITSGFSGANTGWRAPLPPTDVAASDGEYESYIRVNWTPPPVSNYYRVYRSETPDANTATAQTGWITNLSYTDSSATPGQTYYYWVKAAVTSGGQYASGYGLIDDGWRKLYRPDNIQASDGTYVGFIRVTWDAPLGATHYMVYRGPDCVQNNAISINGWQTATTFDDTTATPGQFFYYFVQASVNASGYRPSDLGNCDTGSRPAPPAVVRALSSKTHGTAGDFSLDVSAAGDVESRKGGPTRIRVTFDRPIQAIGGASVEDVTVSSGVVMDVQAKYSEVVFEMKGVNDAAKLVVRFPGIADATRTDLIVTDHLCFGVLEGDANGDSKTNVVDLLSIKNVVNETVGSSNFTNDVNADGKLNVLDLLTTKNNLNRSIRGLCF